MQLWRVANAHQSGRRMGFLSSPFRNAGVFGHKAWQIEIIVEAVSTACRTGHSVIFDLDGQDDFEERYSAIWKLYWIQSSIRKAKQKHCARLCSCSLAWSIRKGKVLNSETKVQTPANLPKSKSLICMSPWVSVVQLYLVPVFQFLPVSLVRILIRVTFQQVGRAQIIWKKK